ncbi:hypothetical protein L486_08082 [Kwoniella mangroviensis CBS 10435]|uniref:Essential protein Yae1 N-terminal domain-containing protein n=1 Tax=Kwoniella mangroviensis CBS 10435 TaxID=1331196 RepID=A0A1B9IGB4_9TREE|nr:uncharacterized protein I203_00964 [Kwoniella mangroviensis CBS 8507]OCF54532.1 hypothetical protein L486_08082 [Kwoniella mangroviensis CBS 10435]OCF69112.1 hypothetical protein I203_00964 [Kwoniella mangroviensis CBS 8507]OCF72679.1 hypothetical protein I204_07063 [Kwoniella mangroviensis CBS 8886]
MNEGEGDVLDEITNMESTFYQQGYQAGYDHGKLHGLFEGRELGKEKAWELWEEIGYYEGWAGTYVDLLEGKVVEGREGRKGKDARALNHAQVLLSLIQSFPTTNPTPSQPNNTITDEPKAEADLDLANLISNIRARYKLLCSSLNVKPRLQVAQIVEVDPRSGAGASGVDGGLDGPVKGVDTSQLRF